MIKGNDIIIKAYDPLDATKEIVIAAAKSCDITQKCETIEVSSPSTGKARCYIPGRTEWSVSISCLLQNFKNGFLKVGTEVKLEIGKTTNGTRTLSTDKMTGKAICTQYHVTAQKGSLAKGAFTFQGNGDLA